MQALGWIVNLWPGVPRILKRGDQIGLLEAIAFSALLNFALISSFVWTELVSPGVRVFVWIAVVLFWGYSVGTAFMSQLSSRNKTGESHTEDLFLAGYSEYLKKNWKASESNFRSLLQQNPRDVDAMLWLASVYRQTDRLSECRQQLKQLEKLERAVKWELEIRREWEVLNELRFTDDQEPTESTDDLVQQVSDAA